ncbi:MAG: hypothetical protein R3B09_34755 [Nannocystaceae bacterium]
MPVIRMPVSLRNAAAALGAVLLIPVLSACPKGDVGAPCNHGSVEPPESKLVTFPALSCNDLLCIYADEAKAPSGVCSDDAFCNAASTDQPRFACVGGKCQLSLTYVLTRSMCSKRCESDDDCKDGGPTEKVLSKDTSCSGSFKCVIIQELGEFCCERLCVCEDDIAEATVDMLATNCENGTIVCESDMGTTSTTTTTTTTTGG